MKIEFTDDARNDYLALPKNIQTECAEMINKLANNMISGQPLEDKNGRDLSDCFKIYFNNAKYRIVYRKDSSQIVTFQGILTNEKIAEIIGIGERDMEKIYKVVAQRLGR